MIRYIGILEKEPGSLWGLWFPDLIGCTIAAETSEGVLEQAPAVLRSWLEAEADEGRPPRPARDLEFLRREHDVAEALAAGHAAVVVSTDEDALLDEAALGAIDAAAERRGLSRQLFIRQVLLEQAETRTGTD